MQLDLIGIGIGNLDQLTAQAIKAIQDANVILLPLKGSGKAELAYLRQRICQHLAPQTPIAVFDMPERDSNIADYAKRVQLWHDEIAQRWRQALASVIVPKRVALLVWGDPSLYDSTLRIAERLPEIGKLRVIPGLTSVQLLCAAFAIPLNSLADGVLITTGRNLREHGLPEGLKRAVVMLDGQNSFQYLSGQTEIFWAAYVGMEQEILIKGPVGEVADKIISARESARQKYGWIMDIYLIDSGNV